MAGSLTEAVAQAATYLKGSDPFIFAKGSDPFIFVKGCVPFR
jgi:hypothetical protein